MSLLIAYIDKDPLKRLHVTDYDKEKHKGKVYCSFGHEVIAKRGEKKAWHFAHVKATDAECSRLMTDWHHWWQDRVYPDFLEITMKKNGFDGKQVIHRADMINGNDTIVEFQKSVIPADTIIKREMFYGDMIWVICCDHPHKIMKQIGQYVRIKFLGGSKFFTETKKPTFLDFDMKGVVEVIKYKSVKKSKWEVMGRIWTQGEFDERYMKGCLRKEADRRVHRPPYVFQVVEEKFEEIEKNLASK